MSTVATMSEAEAIRQVEEEVTTRDCILADAFRRYPHASRKKVRQFSRMRELTNRCLARLKHEATSGMDDQTATAIIYVIHRNSRLLG